MPSSSSRNCCQQSLRFGRCPKYLLFIELSVLVVICCSVFLNPRTLHSQNHPQRTFIPERMLVDIFFNELDSKEYRIIGAEYGNLLRYDKNRNIVTMPHGLYSAKPALAKVKGCLTVYDPSYYIGEDGNISRIKIGVRPINDMHGVWLVVKFIEPSTKQIESMSISGFGDLDKDSKKFQYMTLPENISGDLEVQYLFYTRGGYPIYSMSIEDVCDDPNTKDWGIWWEERVSSYVRKNKIIGTDRKPKPFITTDLSIDSDTSDSKDLEIIIMVNIDGYVELYKYVGVLEPKELDTIKEQLTQWRVFPAIANGAPEVSVISINTER
jgi:hypothetical protein